MKAIAVIVWLIGLVAVIGCQSTNNPDVSSAALESAQTWLALVDEQKYEQSWSQAASYFKNAGSKQQWLDSMQSVKTPSD